MAKKIDHSETWGRKTATERYGGDHRGFEAPPDQSAPQFEIEKPAPGYTNDVPLSGWLRGTDATKKPGFVKTTYKR